MNGLICLLAIFPTAVFSQSYLNDTEQKTLELVQVLFRHGERTPTENEHAALNYTDPDVYEPFGLGELNSNGKKQAYKVGRMLRQRYNGFLNQTYNREDIFAQSAELDRMQASLQLVLAGLYSTGERSKWNPSSNWHPIPYRCAPEKLDVLFRQYYSKKYNKLLEDAVKSPAVTKKIKEFADLLEFFKGKPGVKSNALGDVLVLSNTLFINARMNITLPTWYSDDLNSRLVNLSNLFFDCLTYTTEMKRATAGPLVKTFLKRMNLDGKDDNPRKMYLYSGSDYNMATVARALQVDASPYPDFSSALILEKLRGSDGRLYVRILEWDAINEKLFVRKMKECEEMCAAEDFARICSDLIPSREEMHYLIDDFQGQDLLDVFIKDPLIEKK